jgi:hypothetical protein
MRAHFEATELATALRRESELIRERDELREKLEEAEARCAILAAICNEKIGRTRGENPRQVQ